MDGPHGRGGVPVRARGSARGVAQDQRLDKARKRWPNRKTIDEGHPDYGAMFDDFNYATLVKVAPSFTAWVAKMKLDAV